MRPEMSQPATRSRINAMAEGHDAIRYDSDEAEPPALEFNEQASPGALVSWAWSQLTALDSMLRVLTARRGHDDGEADVLCAVRAILVPAMNALKLSEQRAHELRRR